MGKPLSAVEMAFCEWWESVRHKDIEGGYEQGVALDAWRVAYQIAEKQSRAEVLAAFLQLILNERESYGPECDIGIEGALHVLYDRAKELQPAAYDLEELLRQAELKGLNMGHSTAHVHEPYTINGEVLCPKCVRKLELEKARATLGASK